MSASLARRYFNLSFSFLLCFDRCIRYADGNRIAIYDLFLHRANTKIEVSKETHRYKQHIDICGIVISVLHYSTVAVVTVKEVSWKYHEH